MKGYKILIFVIVSFLYITKVDEQQAHILMAVVKYKTSIVRPRQGLCSSWLSTVDDPNENVQLWINKGTIAFPKDHNTPVIMVGPGMNEPLPPKNWSLAEFRFSSRSINKFCSTAFYNLSGEFSKFLFTFYKFDFLFRLF